MSKLAALLCLLAIIAAQFPMLACASDCHDIMVSVAGGHDCHIAGSHRESADGFHYHGCVGHTHRERAPHEHDDCGDEETGGADHQLVQTPVITDGVCVELPEPAVAGLFPALLVNLRATSQPDAHAALEAAHQAEPDPVPVPLPASVRLLL